MCRNVGELADILHRYSSPVDTGMVVVESRNVGQSVTTVDAVFFTRVHFDIFGLFFPRAVSDLRSATELLMDVYGAENLTVRVSSTELSSSSSSSLPGISSKGAFSRSMDTRRQQLEVYRQELITLRRFGPFLPRDAMLVLSLIHI